jgi:type IV pilus assembly protein PilA
MLKQVQKGFTLIELMIVIAIIGILAAIAIPAYQDYTIRAQASEGLTVASAVQVAVADFYAQNGTFPSGITGGGSSLNFVSAPTGNYVASVTIPSAGSILITYGNKANAALKAASSNTLTLNAYLTTAGDIDWVCGYSSSYASGATAAGTTGSTTVINKYLPKNCQS